MAIQGSPANEHLFTEVAFSNATKTLLEEDSSSSKYAGLLNQRALQLEHELHAIRARQNALVALNRLPPEVLAHIFVLLANNVTNDWRNTKKFSWLHVTHVCRHWRAVALDCGPLWSDLRYFVHPEITKLVLARSKNAPLTIDLSAFNKLTPQYTDPLRDALSQTHRLRVLTIGPMQEHAVELSKILADATGPAPILKRLILRNNKQNPQSIPHDFLLGGAPALETLRIDSFDLPWNRIPLPSGLVRLMLVDAVVRPLPSEFFGSIQGLPLLQDLDLCRYLPDTDSSSPLPLPSLKTLEIRDFWTKLSNFLDIVQAPNIKRIHVGFTDLTTQAAVAECCIRKIKATVQETLKESSCLSQFSICDFDAYSPTVLDPPTLEMGWGPKTLDLSKSGGHEPGFKLEVALSFRRTHTFPVPEAIASINTHFDLTTISTLHINASSSLNKIVFVDVLAKLPKVQELSIISGPVTLFLLKMSLDPALSQKKKRGKGSKLIAPYFPALHTLTLDDVDFEEDSGPDEVCEILTNVVKKRPKPHQLETLDIHICRNFGRESYRRLKKALRNVDVQWDEVEDWTNQSDDFDDSDDEFDEFGPFGFPMGFF